MRTLVPAILASLFPLLAGCVQAQEPPVAVPPQEDAPRQRGTPPGLPGPDGQNKPPAQTKMERMKTGGKNDWFDRTRLQMGDHLKKEVVKGLFKFRNPHGVPVEWKAFSGSCQCAKAVIRVGKRKYSLTKAPVNNALHKIDLKNGVEVKTKVESIIVHPGESGDVEVHMEMAGIQGVKDASLQFATSDKKHPLMLLKWEAMGIKLFNIRPADFFLNDMKWEDEKSFRFTVTSSVKKDFKLLDHEPLPSYVKVKKKQLTLPDGTPAWEVSGTFGPKADPGSGGANIKFKTDLDNKVVAMNVIANVLGPITITPGTFIPLGLIRRKKGAEREVTITPNGDFDLVIEKVEFQQLTIGREYLEVQHKKNGKNLVLSIKVLAGAEPGKRAVIVRGKILVHLNHPAVKIKNFSFNGILR